jgi:hypothetical protein
MDLINDRLVPAIVDQNLYARIQKTERLFEMSNEQQRVLHDMINRFNELNENAEEGHKKQLKDGATRIQTDAEKIKHSEEADHSDRILFIFMRFLEREDDQIFNIWRQLYSLENFPKVFPYS